jgi:deoxyribodipyrimidine photolyase-related protein
VTDHRAGLLILGNQLFPGSVLKAHADLPVFMSEDQGLCSHIRHHQQKIVLYLSAMREYADSLTARGHCVTYHRIEDNGKESYEDRLTEFVENNRLTKLVHFEIEGHHFAERISNFCKRHDLHQQVIESPMFLTTRAQFDDYLNDASRPHMADFYKLQRRRLQILLEDSGTSKRKPAGGKWSHDQSNRKKLPKDIALPSLPDTTITDHTREVIRIVSERFSDHPGQADEFWWPVTRRSALHWLSDFINERLSQFGPYQDAISQRSETAFHSVLSPLLNIGLITPADVTDRVLKHAESNDVPINSLEGLIRQVIGWREFVRGIYHRFDDKQRNENFWSHNRSLTQNWYTGTTDIPPLDHAIKTANRLGWTNHITRLMVVGNLMTLAEIKPADAHEWFMQTHVDSSNWVMGPNVYGMALFSDGGLFATKPYICGSNYLLKMSDYAKGEWCDVVDGLYWRFIDKHEEYFASNHRTSMTVRTLSRLKPERRRKIFSAAENFLATKTKPS